jgi:hypothetical protein
MKATRILTSVLTVAVGLIGLALLVGWPAGSGAAPDLTVTPSATPRYRAHLPHVRYDASPTPPPTPVVTPTRTPYSAAAALTITRFKAINASTFNSSSFVVGNDSLNGERLSELRIDLSTALLPDVVFDPFGQAGDAVAKSYTLDGGLKQASYVFEQPRDGGFDVLVVRYNGFDPGDFSAFSLDIDPTSIKGGSAPGPAESGSVGGLELVGATVTATFDNGQTITGQVTRLPDDGGAGPDHSGGIAVLRAGLPPRPALSVVGVSAPAVVTSANQTVRIGGPAGRPVTVLVVESGLFLAGIPNGGFDIDPFEANNAITTREYQAVVGPGGFVDVPITLTRSGPEAGINLISAVFDDHYGLKGLVAGPVVLELE